MAVNEKFELTSEWTSPETVFQFLKDHYSQNATITKVLGSINILEEAWREELLNFCREYSTDLYNLFTYQGKPTKYVAKTILGKEWKYLNHLWSKGLYISQYVSTTQGGNLEDHLGEYNQTTLCELLTEMDEPKTLAHLVKTMIEYVKKQEGDNSGKHPIDSSDDFFSDACLVGEISKSLILSLDDFDRYKLEMVIFLALLNIDKEKVSSSSNWSELEVTNPSGIAYAEESVRFFIKTISECVFEIKNPPKPSENIVVPGAEENNIDLIFSSPEKRKTIWGNNPDIELSRLSALILASK